MNLDVLATGAAVFAATAALAVVLVPVASRLARRFGVLDAPGARKVHAAPMPRLGGIAVFVSFFVVVGAGYLAAPHLATFAFIQPFLPLSAAILKEAHKVGPQLTGVLIGSTLVFAVGLADDVWGGRFNVWVKAGGQVIGAVVLILAGVRTSFMPYDWMNVLVTLVWVVGMTNAFNLLDNMDGLSAGVAFVASLVLLINAWALDEFFIGFLLLAFMGSLLGFLFFNANPARIFLGDCGSLFIGYLMGSLTLLERYLSHASGSLFPVLMPVLVLAVPIVDTTTVVVIRIREGRPIYVGDRRHLSHRLVSLGFSPKRAVWSLYLMTFALGLGAASLTDATLSQAILVVLQTAGLVLLILLLMFTEREGSGRAHRVIALVLATALAGPAVGTAPQASPSPSPPPAAAPAPEPSPTVEQLYQKILPAPFGGAGTGSESAGGGQVVPEAATRADEERGWRFGFLHFRPAVRVSYIDSDNAFLEAGGPVRARYFQVEPDLGFGIGVSGDVGLLGARLRLQLRAEVPRLDEAVRPPPSDPRRGRGPERAPRAGRDRGRQPPLRARVHGDDGGRSRPRVLLPARPVHREPQRRDGDPRTRGAGSSSWARGSYETLRVEDPAAFFDHRTEGARADARYELGTNLFAVVRYAYARIPRPPDRPEAEATSSTASVGLEGEILPLVRARAFVGFQDQKNPNAGPGGRAYRGTAATVSLTKEFTPSSSLSFTGSRTTYPSAFGANGFYVSDSLALDGNAELPLSAVFHAGVSLQRNAYRVPEAATGIKRRDDLLGWTVGLGRTITRWGYLRADYRHDRRDSNLAAFRTDGRSIIVSFGIGFLGPAEARR